MDFLKGNIIWVDFVNRDAKTLRHPAIVWDDSYNGIGDFHGIMITSAIPTAEYDNILMNVNHFEVGHHVRFNNSHFVNQIFIKFGNWGPFHFAGRLTPEGIQFIEDRLTGLNPVEFSNYIT